MGYTEKHALTRCTCSTSITFRTVTQLPGFWCVCKSFMSVCVDCNDHRMRRCVDLGCSRSPVSAVSVCATGIESTAADGPRVVQPRYSALLGKMAKTWVCVCALSQRVRFSRTFFMRHMLSSSICWNTRCDVGRCLGPPPPQPWPKPVVCVRFHYFDSTGHKTVRP